MEKEDKYSFRNFIPYRVESRVKKLVAEAFKENPIVILSNGKKIDAANEDQYYSIISKIERMSPDELQIVELEAEKNGADWLLDYLYGGGRLKNQLFIGQKKESSDIRIDKFYTFNGIEIF